MQHWEDILYENRNKLYGAYYLRRKHVKYLFLGLVISIGLCGVPLLYLYFKYHKEADTLDMPMSIPVSLSNPAEFEKLIEPAPPVEEKKPALKSSDAAPIVTDSVPKPIKKLLPTPPKVANLDSLMLAQKPKPAEGNGNSTDSSAKMYLSAEQMPQFIGGEDEFVRFIKKHLIYPPEAVKKRIQGHVFIQLTVSPTGDVKNIKLISGVSPELDQEALRIVALLPRWIPAKRGGKAVSIKFNIPIDFTL